MRRSEDVIRGYDMTFGHFLTVYYYLIFKFNVIDSESIIYCNISKPRQTLKFLKDRKCLCSVFQIFEVVFAYVKVIKRETQTKLFFNPS